MALVRTHLALASGKLQSTTKKFAIFLAHRLSTRLVIERLWVRFLQTLAGTFLLISFLDRPLRTSIKVLPGTKQAKNI